VLLACGSSQLQAAIDDGSSSYFSPLAKPRTSSSGVSKDFMRSPIYSTVHVVNDSEESPYSEHINTHLAEDPHVQSLLPISSTGSDFVDKLKSGVILWSVPQPDPCIVCRSSSHGFILRLPLSLCELCMRVDCNQRNARPGPTIDFSSPLRFFLWVQQALVNVAVPDTIDVRAINIKAGRKLNAWEQQENITLCINSARAIGCQVASIGTQEVVEGRVRM